MLTLLTTLALAAQKPADAADCVLAAIPEAQNAAVGEAVLARKEAVAEGSPLLAAVNDCARRYSLSVERALNVSGYASMHLAAKTVARQFGHPGWARYAVVAVRRLTPTQRLALSEPETGAAEFKTVLVGMAEQDAAIVPALQALDDSRTERLILMVRLFAVAEVQRDHLAKP